MISNSSNDYNPHQRNPKKSKLSTNFVQSSRHIDLEHHNIFVIEQEKDFRYPLAKKVIELELYAYEKILVRHILGWSNICIILC